jgi:cyclomaltodextrinase / maltogenic alpha-amylase / neopullulanase
LIAATLLAVVAQAGLVEHTFTFVPDRPVQRVNLAGAFNGWSRDADPMRLMPDGRTYGVTLKIRPGRYHYKFVLDGEEWVVDPRAKSEDDGSGHINSILLLLPPDYVQPARLGDGNITRSPLAHVNTVPDFNWDRGRLTISFTARPNDIQRVEVVANGRALPMQRLSQDEIVARYRVEVPWDRASDLTYSFRLVDGPRTAFFGPAGLTDRRDRNEYRVDHRTYKPFIVPDWVERTVMYQIFPDRFENGDKSNDPTTVVSWDAKPTYFNRFGGDAAGIQKRMPHLRDLGIGAIYFNPVFVSPSNHRYEAIDYYTIDPEIGTNDEFVALTRNLERNGIRTILDGVFNHTAVDFFAFKDIRDQGAASPYNSWYFIREHPVRIEGNPNYEAWFNFPSMPKTNLLNPVVRDYMLEIPRRWDGMASVHGWRLDVANEVPMPFWRAFRNTVKGIGEDRWIVGEHWGDSSPWLSGDQWDSTMNYQFREAVLQLLGQGRSGRPSEFMRRLMHTYGTYAPQVSRNAMNLLGSHDTPRILTEVGGDKDFAKLAAVVLFTWIGSPCVYYGDELGMEGGADPENRRGMRWDLATPDNSFLQHYRQLIALRNGSRVLQSGDPVSLLADDAAGTAAYARLLDGDGVIVALNKSDGVRSVRVRIPAGMPRQGLQDVLGGVPVSVTPSGELLISLAPKRAAIITPRSGSSSTPHIAGRASVPNGPRPLHQSAQEHR